MNSLTKRPTRPDYRAVVDAIARAINCVCWLTV